MISGNPVRPVVRMVHSPRGLGARLAVLMVMAMFLLAPAEAGAQAAQAAPPSQAASTTQAAPPSEGWGWWVGGGGGYIAGRLDCDNCQEDPPYGDNGAYLFQGGVRMSERLHIGGEIFTFGRTIQDIHFRQSYLLGIAQFRPWASQGFFLKGGYGMAFVKEVVPGGDDIIRTWGMGLTYGAGWIIDAGQHVSVAPYGAHYVTTVGDVPTPLGTAENVVGNGWFVGAAIMIR